MQFLKALPTSKVLKYSLSEVSNCFLNILPGTLYTTWPSPPPRNIRYKVI
jgi:hypothetical protein